MIREHVDARRRDQPCEAPQEGLGFEVEVRLARHARSPDRKSKQQSYSLDARGERAGPRGPRGALKPPGGLFEEGDEKR